MRLQLINRGLRSQYDLKRTPVFANCKRFSVSNNGYSDMDRPISSFIPERNPEFSSRLENVQNGVDNAHGWSEAFSSKLEGVRQTVDNVCKILQSGPWGPSMEIALSKCDENPSTELVTGVLRRLEDVNTALNYFRWAEKTTRRAHCPEAYNSLLMAV
ncbi:hypothetical protein K7X08_008506 [Anisodus acutangulus]|uniref:Uncharacterized protein n=1 Tax=Anisodus acutangulus TaxID=402998 RepID=A0A9Q1MU29_9SOLA|nr:hypothetical protein K7X08_008506 [Anisodus acutangulus]